METKITKFLDQNKIKYQLVEHRKVYTAFSGAQTQHVDPKGVVKTVLIKLSKPTTYIIEPPSPKKTATQQLPKTTEWILVAVPAKKRLDFKKIAKVINDHALKSHKIISKSVTGKLPKSPAPVTAKMAKEKDITKQFKTKVGLLSAFSQIYGIPLLFDKKLSLQKKLTVSAGSYTQSIEILTKDFLKIMNGIQGSFTE